jgi:hypothetical protein
MPQYAGLKGINKVMRNLNKELEQYEQKSLKGLIEFAIDVRQDMDKTPPVIPVDQGNLRASWTVVTMKGVSDGGGSFSGENAGELASDHSSKVSAFKSEAAAVGGVVMGFTANYAVYVHENAGANFKRPGAGAYFFESALNSNKQNAKKYIERNARR